MSFVKKIRAGRAYLGWNQDKLSIKSGVEKSTISQIELGNRAPKQETLEKLEVALNRYGLFFLEHGIEKRDIYTQIFTGENHYCDVLNDVLSTLNSGDTVYFLYVNEGNSSEGVIALRNRIRERGIITKSLIKHGDINFSGSLDNYRWIPENHFDNHITVVYGDKVALCFRESAEIKYDARWSRQRQNEINMIWDILPEPKVTQ